MFWHLEFLKYFQISVVTPDSWQTKVRANETHFNMSWLYHLDMQT